MSIQKIQLDIDINTLPFEHLENYYYPIYLNSSAKGTKLSHIYNLYILNNRAAMSILGALILYENDLKNKLANVLLEKYKNKSLSLVLEKQLKIKDSNNKMNKSTIETIEDIKKVFKKEHQKYKKSDNFIHYFCDQLSFGQIRALIKFLKLEKIFGIFTCLSNKTSSKLVTLNKFRNHFAHGFEMKPFIEDKYGTKHRLSTVLKILFRKYHFFQKDIESLITEYNFYKINLDPGHILNILKIQGLFKLKSANKIIDKKPFFDFYIGHNYEKIIKKDRKIIKEFPELFGKTKFYEVFKISTEKSVERNANFVRWYKRYLSYKEKASELNKNEMIIKMILINVGGMKIKKSILHKIIETSFIDLHRIKKICSAFKIEISNDEAFTCDPQKISVNKLLFNGYLRYETNYLVNHKANVLKITKNYPYFENVHKSQRTNNFNRVHYQVSINSQPKALHKICAELFVPNPKKYKYVGVKGRKFLNFNISDLEWIKYPAKPRVTKRLLPENKQIEKNSIDTLIKKPEEE